MQYGRVFPVVMPGELQIIPFCAPQRMTPRFPLPRIAGVCLLQGEGRSRSVESGIGSLSYCRLRRTVAWVWRSVVARRYAPIPPRWGLPDLFMTVAAQRA
jgi:hypothetical protein